MSHSNGSFIQIEGLTKHFGAKAILDGVDLTIQTGQTVALIGPSGGGKSTLLRSINGLNGFNHGRIRVGPHTLEPSGPRPSASHRAAASQIRRLVGMVFQDFQLFPHFTALQNVIEGPVQVLGQSPREAETLGQSLLERVGLGQRMQHYPHQLSGGQKQRVAIARALAMSPECLLCDEITSALDPELKVEVLEVLADLKRDGMTLVLVTHEIGFARRAADRVVVLADGKIIEQGPPAQVIDHPQVPRTRQFLSRVLA